MMHNDAVYASALLEYAGTNLEVVIDCWRLLCDAPRRLPFRVVPFGQPGTVGGASHPAAMAGSGASSPARPDARMGNRAAGRD
jgi:hypothetical protein